MQIGHLSKNTITSSFNQTKIPVGEKSKCAPEAGNIMFDVSTCSLNYGDGTKWIESSDQSCKCNKQQCTVDVKEIGSINELPKFIIPGSVTATYYDGVTDDLLTAGLGKTGLAGAAPVVTNTQDIQQLRRLAIYNNYRALVDIQAVGGYGTLYGPNVLNDGTVTASEGKISGWEYIGVVDDGTGDINVTVMIQIPDTFDINNPSIVTATSSGFRGIYGAISAAGEWGLKNRSAVVYTDKGTGTGYDDLMLDLVTQINGILTPAAVAAKQSLFTAKLSASERAIYNATFPNRVAIKTYHNQRNGWSEYGGLNTLQSIAFGFYVLNERYGISSSAGKIVILSKPNTIVLASGISAGGLAALQAIEQDGCKLIDGAAVSEPGLWTEKDNDLIIRQGANEFTSFGQTIWDYLSYANLYEPAAAVDPRCQVMPLPAAMPLAYAQNRCTALYNLGLLSSSTLSGQASEALEKLRCYGFLPESDILHPNYWNFANLPLGLGAIVAASKAKVTDNVAGYSFANTDGTGLIIPQVASTAERLFGTSSGAPPIPGVNICYNNAVGPVKLNREAISPSSGLKDFAADGAVSLRNIYEGVNIVTGQILSSIEQEQAVQIQASIKRSLLTSNLSTTPVIMVTGRPDTLTPVNFCSRPYFGKNQLKYPNPNFRYLEVMNAQHFDTFIDALPGFNIYYIPLIVYLNQARNVMFSHLKFNTALPASQVVRTIPRGVGAPPITPANVPPFPITPALGDEIKMIGRVLQIPN